MLVLRKLFGIACFTGWIGLYAFLIFVSALMLAVVGLALSEILFWFLGD